MEFPQPLHSVILTVVVLIAGAANYGGVAAQSSGCATSLATLYPCVGYIISNDTTSPPPQSCCSALSSVVQSNAVCVCQLFMANNSFGFPINQTQALALPGSCKISIPELTQCKGTPAPSPATGSSIALQPPTGSVPSSSPAPPTSKSPSNAGAFFTPSTIISVVAGAIVMSTMC